MVKIVEFSNPLEKQERPFDVVDDLTIFMRNDPAFYRKHYFPMMAKISDMHEKGESIDPVVILKPTVDKAVDSYCRRFKIKKRPEDLFFDEDRKEVCNKIYKEELPHIKEGSYCSK
jgi:hypothetical protein